jgi:putative heme-binding domain-containing protein
MVLKEVGLFGTLCCFGLGLLGAQDQANVIRNPFATPDDVAAGERSFRSQCAACHGPDASGAAGPSLTTGTFRHGNSDEALFGVITKGVPGTPMAAFKLDGREVWQLISFLRATNIAKGAGQAPGDPARGVQVFNDSGCAQCHTAGKPGGFAGPDLAEVGSRRTLAQLERALLDPDAEVDPDYWSLRARTKTGQTVGGIRMNEDTDSFQILEPSGRLRSVWKTDLASYELVRNSPMPSFKGKLKPSELQDLVAYLASLRAPASHEGQP